MTGSRKPSSVVEEPDVDAPTSATYGRAVSRDHPVRAVVVGILVGIVAALGLWGVALSTPQQYRSTAYVVVVPTGQSNLDQAAGLFDSLSRGQVVATASTMLSRTWWAGDDYGVSFSAGEVTPSSVIKVSVTGSDPALLDQILTDTLRRSTPLVNAAIKPYEVLALPRTSATAERVGLSLALRLLITALAGTLVAAITTVGVQRFAPRS